MFRHQYSVFIITCLAFMMVQSQDFRIMGKLFDVGAYPKKADWLISEGKEKVQKAVINMYYETHCKTCRIFDTVELAPTVAKIGDYMELNLYPYGRSKTLDKGNGNYEFECRHGPEECYGNKLHLCAMEFFGNISKAVKFNSCMMEFYNQDKGSDDIAADRCGKAQGVDVDEIKQCAKTRKGTELLKKAGDETKKFTITRAPLVILNGEKYDITGDLFNDVCDSYVDPPRECQKC